MKVEEREAEGLGGGAVEKEGEGGVRTCGEEGVALIEW